MVLVVKLAALLYIRFILFFTHRFLIAIVMLRIDDETFRFLLTSAKFNKTNEMDDDYHSFLLIAHTLFNWSGDSGRIFINSTISIRLYVLCTVHYTDLDQNIKSAIEI